MCYNQFSLCGTLLTNCKVSEKSNEGISTKRVTNGRMHEGYVQGSYKLTFDEPITVSLEKINYDYWPFLVHKMAKCGHNFVKYSQFEFWQGSREESDSFKEAID